MLKVKCILLLKVVNEMSTYSGKIFASRLAVSQTVMSIDELYARVNERSRLAVVKASVCEGCEGPNPLGDSVS